MASKKQTVKAAQSTIARYTNGASTAELSQDALITRHLRRTTEQRYRDENQNQNQNSS
ncbi:MULTISPECIES: hypothetical protein [unclassified Streptomyces]|uniref:hypothetical protein n=1 Tax=unclassified Streptomyces TaxID=2593676 RepID=UPI003438DD17